MTGKNSSFLFFFSKSLNHLHFLDSNSRSPSNTHLTSKSPMKKSNEEPCRFTRELEQRLQNGLFNFLIIETIDFYQFKIGDISEEAKHAYNLLINGRTNSSSEQSHCTSDGDLSSSNNHEIDHHSKPSPPPPPKIVLFGSSSSSSTSISTSSTSNNTQSNTSSSSNQQKSDRNSHYSSTSTDNDISMDLKPHNELSPLK